MKIVARQRITACCRLVVFCLFAFSYSGLLIASPTAEINLEGDWKFKPGDDPSWAGIQFDDSHWSTLKIPHSWPANGFPETGQMAWYRLKVNVSALGPDFLIEPGIRLGAMRSAYQLYVGGQYLGGIGRLPPQAEINYDKFAVYRIPHAAIGADGELQIAIRVWGGTPLSVSKSSAGTADGEFLLGNYTQLLQDMHVEQIPTLLFANLFMFVGLYFLYLYSRNRALISFFWFGLTAIVLAVYVVTQSQWKYLLGFDFITYEKIETSSVQLFFALLIQLVWTIVDRPINWLLRIYQLAFVVLAIVIALTPGLDIHFQVRHFWQFSVVLGIVPMYWVVGQQVLRGHKDARTLLIGLLVFTVCAVNDLLLNMQLVHTAHLIPVGFLAVMVSMVVSLANKFTAMLVSLEQQVQDRTAELVSVNEQLATANEQLEELSRHDPLTSLLNRRGFINEAEIERQRFLRSGESLVVVIADIDHFKNFNDNYGHACGDMVLENIGFVLQHHLRDIDRVARWGGEEFVLLLPNTSEEGALRITEKLREKVSSYVFDYEGEQLSVTMTFGAAICQKQETLDECIERADAALYEGKTGGRNRVVMAS